MKLFFIMFFAFCTFFNKLPAVIHNPTHEVIQELINRDNVKEYIVTNTGEVILVYDYGVGIIQIDDKSEWESPDLYMQYSIQPGMHVWLCPMTSTEVHQHRLIPLKKCRITHWILTEQLNMIFPVAKRPYSHFNNSI